MITKYKIKTLEEKEYPEWNNLVDNSPNGTIFHKSWWLKASGRDFVIYGYFREKKLYAGIAFCFKKILQFRIASHPPLTPYSGILFMKQNLKYVNKLSETKQITTEIVSKIKNDFSSIAFSFFPGTVDLQPFIWKGFSTSIGYTYIINLDKDLDEIWNNMSSKTKNHIRKAEKDGICVIETNNFNSGFNMVKKTFKRQNKKTYFESVAHKYDKILKKKKQSRWFIATKPNGKAVAAIYIAWDNKKSYQLLAGYDQNKYNRGSVAFAIWKAIQFSKKKLGLNQYDFEGSMLPEIEKFFRKFGGDLTSYYTVNWSPCPLRGLFYIKKIIKNSLLKF